MILSIQNYVPQKDIVHQDISYDLYYQFLLEQSLNLDGYDLSFEYDNIQIIAKGKSPFAPLCHFKRHKSFWSSNLISPKPWVNQGTGPWNFQGVTLSWKNFAFPSSVTPFFLSFLFPQGSTVAACFSLSRPSSFASKQNSYLAIFLFESC